MKKFKFKLAQVLKYRLLLEEIAKSEYQKALSDLNLKIKRRHEMEQERQNVRKDLGVKKGSQVSPETIQFITIYVRQLGHLIEVQKEQIAKQREITEKKLGEWTERRKDSKVIKKLEEKQKKLHFEMVEKEEQKFLDEIFIAKMSGEREDEN